MTAKKKLPPKKAAIPTVADAIKAAYRTLGFASGFKVGDKVSVDGYMKNQIPKGSGCKPNDHYFGDPGVCQGVTADGDIAVRIRGKDYIVPHTFVTRTTQSGQIVKLNGEYSAAIIDDGETVEVGCQTFPANKVLELAKAIADTREAVVKAAAMPATINYTPTYKPAAAAKKKKKPATKTPTKKAPKKAPKKKRAVKKPYAPVAPAM